MASGYDKNIRISPWTEPLQPCDATLTLQTMRKINTLAHSFSSLSHWLPSSAPAWKSEWQFLWWRRRWWFLCLSVLNFNSQQSTAVDVAVCIINDVQIPHMKGLHCGPDKRLCVLSCASLTSSRCFLISVSSYIIYSPAVCFWTRFLTSLSEKSCWKMSVNEMSFFFLPTVESLFLNITAFDVKKQPFVFILFAVWTIVFSLFFCWTRCQQKTISWLRLSSKSACLPVLWSHLMHLMEARLNTNSFLYMLPRKYIYTFSTHDSRYSATAPDLSSRSHLTCELAGKVSALTWLDVDLLPSTGNPASLQKERPFL